MVPTYGYEIDQANNIRTGKRHNGWRIAQVLIGAAAGLVAVGIPMAIFTATFVSFVYTATPDTPAFAFLFAMILALPGAALFVAAIVFLFLKRVRMLGAGYIAGYMAGAGLAAFGGIMVYVVVSLNV